MQQGAQPVEHVVLFRGAPLGGKGVAWVSREAAREVFAYVAIGDLLGAVHQNLGTIVQLRDALDGEQQSQGLLQGGYVLPVAQEAVCVVVFDKRHHA